MPIFSRPTHHSFPQIFSKFKAKDIDSDEIVEYHIKDLPENRFEEALELYIKHFIDDETMCCSKNISKNPDSIKVFCDFWIECFKLKLSIGCFKGDELVAVNCLVVCSKDDPNKNKNFENKDVQDIFDALIYTFQKVDIYRRYNVEKYLAAYGLVVRRNYRGRNIATEMLKARVYLMKRIGVNLTATAFTVIGSQKAAKNSGFEDIFEISYEDFKKIDPRFDFSKSSSETYKIMALKI